MPSVTKESQTTPSLVILKIMDGIHRFGCHPPQGPCLPNVGTTSSTPRPMASFAWKLISCPKRRTWNFSGLVGRSSSTDRHGLNRWADLAVAGVDFPSVNGRICFVHVCSCVCMRKLTNVYKCIYGMHNSSRTNITFVEHSLLFLSLCQSGCVRTNNFACNTIQTAHWRWR